MKKVIFRGIATALITPTSNTGVDYKKLAKLLDWQIAEGIDALVVCGTTGESSTLSDAEHRRVISFSVDHVAGRVPVIAGTGSNETDYALSLTRHACRAGADAALVVTPYYNKATQKGLVRMYRELADHGGLPIIAYNVPSRTGVNLESTTCALLAEHENIVGLKEAGGNLSQMMETAALTAGRLPLYAGNDDQIVPVLSMGGLGCISVLSNLLPRAAREIVNRFTAGDVAGSMALQCRYQKLISALFCEVNPIPVKAAMSALGYCENYLRLPLTPMEEDHRERLLYEMREVGLAV
ncbi:MAG: 4-hydroxy-tetrahydrodipicolinate synthase [Clostridia bacterium]|nr:4-hydroxy-tetrahydrodipicolinate synthase [Clostridia bacterium]